MFSALYFQDENSTDAEYRHALRSLPYLIYNNNHLREVSEVIFSRLLEEKGSNEMSSTSVSTDSVRKLVTSLIKDEFITKIPDDLLGRLDNIINTSTIGFHEFSIYLRLIVKVAVLLHSLKGLITAVCACQLTNRLLKYRSSIESVDAASFIDCLSNPKIKLMVSTIPGLSDDSSLLESRPEGGIHTALKSAIQNIGEKKDTKTTGICPSDIVTELLGDL